MLWLVQESDENDIKLQMNISSELVKRSEQFVISAGKQEGPQTRIFLLICSMRRRMQSVVSKYEIKTKTNLFKLTMIISVQFPPKLIIFKHSSLGSKGKFKNYVLSLTKDWMQQLPSNLTKSSHGRTPFYFGTSETLHPFLHLGTHFWYYFQNCRQYAMVMKRWSLAVPSLVSFKWYWISNQMQTLFWKQLHYSKFFFHPFIVQNVK